MGAPPLRTERASNLMPKGRARDGGGIEPPDRRPPQSANPPRRRFPPSTYRPAVAGGIQWASNAACEPSRSPQDAFSGLGDSPYLHPADSAVPAIHSLAVRGRPVCRISTDLTARRLLVSYLRGGKLLAYYVRCDLRFESAVDLSHLVKPRKFPSARWRTARSFDASARCQVRLTLSLEENGAANRAFQLNNVCFLVHLLPMQSRMGLAIQQHKVLDSVVRLVVIDMMHNLTVLQEPSQVVLNYGSIVRRRIRWKSPSDGSVCAHRRIRCS